MSMDLTQEHLLGILRKLTQIKSNIAWFLKVVEEKKVVEKMVVEEKNTMLLIVATLCQCSPFEKSFGNSINNFF